MSTAALDAITRAFYARGLMRSAVAAQSTFIAATCRAYDYIPARATAAASPLRCAYCATYFVPAGRSCGCGANREEAAPPRREVAAQLRQIDLNTRVTARLMNVYNRR